VRARLILQLIALVVVLILTFMGARACSGVAKSSSPLTPLNVARNGFAGLCANAQATAAAGGADPANTPASVVSPSELQQLQASDPGGLAAVQKAVGGSLACPTTTTP
jgi:hypothetical protein